MNYLINTLCKKEKNERPPIWIMRQAGRYLPEYRADRSQAKDFLNLCYTPELASKVTLQPIERFKFDAAIIFSDILVIPDALGMDVKFIKGEGPKLEKISELSDLKNLKIDNIKPHLNPVFEALKLTKSKLDSDTALIGFSGSPWTLASYMIEGGGSKAFENTRRKAIEDERFFSELIEILTQSIILYLSHKIEAGATVIKLFDSWAGVLPPEQLRKWVINPTKRIVSELNKLYPNIPIICFPRGIGVNYLEFAQRVQSQGLAIDQTLDKKWVKKHLQEEMGVVIQGNLDNVLLAFGSKEEIKKETLNILETFGDHPFIFNLGHGILPPTPIENVQMVVDLVRGNKV